jgi:hypothetical protein
MSVTTLQPNTVTPGADAKPRVRETQSWTGTQRFLFRIAFIFFIAISIPNSAEWYKLVAHIDWTNLHYRDLYDIARFGSGINFFGNSIFGSTLLGYANWITTALIAVGGAAIWTWIEVARKKVPANYNNLYYWLRVVVRYRAGIGIIGFGFTKLLPVQMPYPSFGLLNTDFGDFTAQKIYWLSIGIVPWYQVFAGVVEVAAGTLLFFRRTTTLGAILLFGALGDIVYVNFAYDGGVHVYSSYFVLLAAFLLIPDVPRIYRLLVQEKVTRVFHYYPDLSKPILRFTRFTLKAAVLFIFLGLLFYLQYINWRYDPYKQPSVAGLKELRGTYAVTEFRRNNQSIPFSPLDSTRWQEVTFEKWTTMTYKVNCPTPIDLSNGGGDPQRDVNRTFELTGTGGGRRVFHYYPDVATKTLYLEDKFKAVPDRRNRAAGVGGDGGTDRNNGIVALSGEREISKARSSARDSSWIPKDALARIGSEVDKIDPRAASTRRNREFAEAPKSEKRNHMVLAFATNDGSHVILQGVDEHRDSLYIVLDKVDKKYALSESPFQAGKY